MKKNFVKKLALGLAMVMAVTSVNVPASAATKPAFKTASVSVEEGETVKAVIKKTKGWTVKKVVSKDETVATISKVAQKAKKTNVKVTGVKAGETKVVATLKKGDSKVKAKLAVEVTAKEEVATLKSVEATGAKEITVTFTGAMDTASKVVVKKGTTTPAFTAKWAEDAKSVVLTMNAKLTAGTYDVAVGELSGSVTVTDETATTIEVIGNSLVICGEEKKDDLDADYNSDNDQDDLVATISYKVLNQYGERMAQPGNVTAASTFGKSWTDDAATAKDNGTVTVVIDADILKIVGTEGTITLVDSSKGLTTTANVVLSSKATATSMTTLGVLNADTLTEANMYRGCKPTNYILAVQIKDQYDNVLDIKDLASMKIAPNFVAGTTNVAIADEWEDIEIGDEDYIAIPFLAALDDEGNDKTISVGTFYFTFVNENAGLLGNFNFTVEDGVVVKSVNIYANDTIYNKTENELGFEVIDVNGEEITAYNKLADTVAFNTDEIKWEVQTDGTAKLIYTPGMTFTNTDNNKEKSIGTIVITANEKVVSDYLVKTVNFTVFEEQEAVAVVGLNSKAYTAVAINGSITLKKAQILVEDQYGNTLSAALFEDYAGLEKPTADGLSIEEEGETKYVITPDTLIEGENTKVSFKLDVQEKPYEVTYYVVNPYKATNLSLTINDGYQIYADTAYGAATSSAINLDKLTVVGTVGGKKVEIPDVDGQYVITGNTGYSSCDKDKVGNVVLDGTLEVTVDTVDGPVVLTKEYKYSNIAAYTTELYTYDYAKTSKTTRGEGLADKDLFKTLFVCVSQYGGATVDAGSIKYTVAGTDANGKELVVKNNATNAASFTAEAGSTFKVTATINGMSATVKVDVVAAE